MNEEKNNPPETALPPVLTEKAVPNAAFTPEPLVPVLTDILPKEEKKMPSAVQTLDNLPWQELEERLTARIQQHVIQRMNVALDDNLARHVSALMEKAVALLVDEVKNDIQKTLEVIVVHAVSAEMQHLRKKILQEEKPSSTER